MTDDPLVPGRMAPPNDPLRLTARLAETQDQLSASSEVLSVLARATSSEEDVFQAVVANARRLCEADVAQISLAEGDGFRLASFLGHDPDYVAFAVEHLVPGNRSSLIGRVALDRTTRQIDDVLADPDYNLPEYQRRGRYRSIMGAPMVVDDEVVGVLMVWRTQVRPFDDHVAQLLTTFAAQAALAVRTGQLFSALQEQRAGLTRKVEEMQALAEIGTAISSLSLDHDEVLTTIVEHAVSLAGADGGSLMDYDEQSSLFRVRTAWGTQSEVLGRLQSVRIHLDETLVGRAALTGSPVQVPDLSVVDRDPHLDVLYDAGWRSLVAVPLTRPDRIVGVLVVRRLTTGTFSDETCDMLTAFAVQSAVALTNVRLYQQLESQRRELEETSRHKSEFLASMSHELRTPLNAVIGFSEVLLERMFGDLNDRQAEYVRDILDAGRHLLDLLNDVLDLSKVEAGHMEIQQTTFPVADVVHSVLALLRERAQLSGLDLGSDLSRAGGLARADELRFKQVLLNLVGNAVKFTPAGGSVTVTATRDGSDLVLEVTDTGVGIAEDERERIFDSFQQGTRKESAVEGTGLGLTLTRRIVELHGGRIWLTSEVGVGSTFGVTFPNQPPDRVSVAPMDFEVPVEDSRPTVVVIEDDPSSSELVQVHLGAAGLRAVPVPSGEQGLEAIRALRPTAVVLDIHLPGMDGWDVLSAVKADPALADIPVVVVSVLPERGRGFALGAADYLVKPVGREELLGAVWRAVSDGADHDPARRRGIVVIDDDPVALELIRATLEPHGWTVTTTDRGADALEVVRAASPSVVLVDLLMPGVDGFAVVDMLRADPLHAATPVVVLTSKTLTAADRERLRGRIEFVASKGALELDWLAGRLSQVAMAGRRAGGGAG